MNGRAHESRSIGIETISRRPRRLPEPHRDAPEIGSAIAVRHTGLADVARPTHRVRALEGRWIAARLAAVERFAWWPTRDAKPFVGIAAFEAGDADAVQVLGAADAGAHRRVAAGGVGPKAFRVRLTLRHLSIDRAIGNATVGGLVGVAARAVHAGDRRAPVFGEANLVERKALLGFRCRSSRSGWPCPRGNCERSARSCCPSAARLSALSAKHVSSISNPLDQEPKPPSDARHAESNHRAGPSIAGRVALAGQRSLATAAPAVGGASEPDQGASAQKERDPAGDHGRAPRPPSLVHEPLRLGERDQIDPPGFLRPGPGAHQQYQRVRSPFWQSGAGARLGKAAPLRARSRPGSPRRRWRHRAASPKGAGGSPLAPASARAPQRRGLPPPPRNRTPHTAAPRRPHRTPRPRPTP